VRGEGFRAHLADDRGHGAALACFLCSFWRLAVVRLEGHAMILDRYVAIPGATPGEVTPIYVDIARSPAQRRKGLRGRSSLPANHGMLFVHDPGENPAYTMYGCLIALDFLWLDAHGRVVDGRLAAPPCRVAPCFEYRSDVPASYVLELLGGVACYLRVVRGTTIDLRSALL
jgi:uncharacterized protein